MSLSDVSRGGSPRGAPATINVPNQVWFAASSTIGNEGLESRGTSRTVSRTSRGMPKLGEPVGSSLEAETFATTFSAWTPQALVSDTDVISAASKNGFAVKSPRVKPSDDDDDDDDNGDDDR